MPRIQKVHFDTERYSYKRKGYMVLAVQTYFFKFLKRDLLSNVQKLLRVHLDTEGHSSIVYVSII